MGFERMIKILRISEIIFLNTDIKIHILFREYSLFEFFGMVITYNMIFLYIILEILYRVYAEFEDDSVLMIFFLIG